MEDNTIENEDERQPRCVHCDASLNMGVDVIAVENGVLGPRGFVPLESPFYVCGDECADKHFRTDDDQVVKMTQRVP